MKKTREQISKNMRAVKCKDSKIEIILRRELWNRRLRYRKNYDIVVGKPDIAFPKIKLAIFCDSEFWHGYDWDNRKEQIKSNREFWFKKIKSNMERDKFVSSELEKQGWTILRFWGKDIEKDVKKCADIIENKIKELREK